MYFYFTWPKMNASAADSGGGVGVSEVLTVEGSGFTVDTPAPGFAARSQLPYHDRRKLRGVRDAARLGCIGDEENSKRRRGSTSSDRDAASSSVAPLADPAAASTVLLPRYSTTDASTTGSTSMPPPAEPPVPSLSPRGCTVADRALSQAFPPAPPDSPSVKQAPSSELDPACASVGSLSSVLSVPSRHQCTPHSIARTAQTQHSEDRVNVALTLPRNPGRKAAPGRVRLYRVRSFLSDALREKCPGTITQPGSLLHRVTEKSDYGRTEGFSSSTNGFRTGLGMPLTEEQCHLDTGTREAAGKLAELENRALRICKRLQVVQAKQVERHVLQQLKGLVTSVLRGERSLLAAGVTTPRGSSHGPGPQRLDLAEVDRLVDSSVCTLRSAESAFDSDATASSSGGDSDMEEREFYAARPSHRHRPLSCQAEWQWAEQRAALGSRWAWLQAQVSDLEYRIRQQTELCRHTRTSKVPVVLGEAPSSDELCHAPPHLPSALHLIHGLNHQTSHSVHSLDSVFSSSCSGTTFASSRTPVPPCPPNGALHSSLSYSPEQWDVTSDVLRKKQQWPEIQVANPSALDSSCVAARVRPLWRHQRRKLVRVGATPHLRAKSVSLQCNCEPPSVCIGWGERSLSSQTSDQKSRSIKERAASLDPSFHPVLSFFNDCPLHLLLEGRTQETSHTAKSLLGEQSARLHRHKEEGQWHQKHGGVRLSQLKKKVSESSRSSCHRTTPSIPSSAKLPHNKNNTEHPLRHRLDSWQPTLDFQTNLTMERTVTPVRKIHSTPLPSSCVSRTDKLQRGTGSLSPYIPKSSPEVPQPAAVAFGDPVMSSLSAASSQPSRRRRVENSFDINNIVIPMSMAGGARFEKLQYKEILTPSWRHLNCDSVLPPRTYVEKEDEYPETDEVEDTSDEAYLSRHQPCEEREKSRWSSWALSSSQRRGGRSSNKGEGRLTPQPQLLNAGPTHPVSPPEMTSVLLIDSPYLCSQSPPDTRDQRSRGLSFSEDTMSSIPDEEVLTVLPWEPRSFPLSEEELKLVQNQVEERTFHELWWHQRTNCDSSGSSGGGYLNNLHKSQTEATDSGISLVSADPTATPPSPSVSRCGLHSVVLHLNASALSDLPPEPAVPQSSVDLGCCATPLAASPRSLLNPEEMTAQDR
uniref:KAT8 regulatory NSL complex subunit 1-like n=1 Tax=Erpetoichthys calabaricus TaxID=27687 RepID=A0A8C4T5J3_ERPCA